MFAEEFQNAKYEVVNSFESQSFVHFSGLHNQALRRFLWSAQIKFSFDADKLLISWKLTWPFF